MKSLTVKGKIYHGIKGFEEVSRTFDQAIVLDAATVTVNRINGKKFVTFSNAAVADNIMVNLVQPFNYATEARSTKWAWDCEVED